MIFYCLKFAMTHFIPFLNFKIPFIHELYFVIFYCLKFVMTHFIPLLNFKIPFILYLNLYDTFHSLSKYLLLLFLD